MHLFQIEKMSFKPLLVIAEDYNHAAEIPAAAGQSARAPRSRAGLSCAGGVDDR